jgi:serine/threonine protein kinase
MASLGGGRVDRLEAGDPSHIGPFRLLGRLGEGGMGRVFLGASPGGRKVAIKVVHPRHTHDPEFRRRFAHEVAAARRVGGFHAALVVDADPDADPPWMATAYIAGPSLADAVDQNGPLAEAAVHELGAALAEGLGAIHACGIIHRDLKPGNIIMADDGPRIIDFGIAKSADASSLTGSNAVIGTLRYMSPEQLNGELVTQKSDIFALGAILTYAATGHNPFDGPNIPATIGQILHAAPRLDPLAGELRDIIGGCLAREPGARPNAFELLARFNAVKPSAVTPAGAPATAGPPAPVPTLLMAAPAQVYASGPPSAAALAKSPGAPVIGAPAPVPAPQVQSASQLASSPTGPVSAPQARPATAPTSGPAPKPKPGPGPGPGRGPGPGPAPAVGPQPPARTAPRRRYPRPLILAAVGVVVAAGLTAGLITQLGKSSVKDTSVTGSLVTTLSAPTSQLVWSVAFGPDHVLAAGDRSGRIYLWNTSTGRLATSLSDPASQAGVFSVAFEPGSGILAAGENDGRTDLWNTATGKPAGTLSDPSSQVVPSLAFGPDGTLATDQVHSVDVWNTTTQTRTATLTDPGTSGVFSVAFGPGGILAVADDNGHAYLWNTGTRTIVATLADPAGKAVDSVAFGPDGTLATGDSSGHVYLWDTATKSVTTTLTDPGSQGVNSVAFGPYGWVAAGDGDGHVYLWDSGTGKLLGTLTDPASTGVNSVAFAPNGTLATGDHNGRTYLWNIG